MTRPIHPLQATQRIRDDYARYLRTIYFFREEDLRRQFWEALDSPNFLVRGPILEAAPPFYHGRSVAKLIDAGVLHRDFRQLCSDALPLERPLYLHQDQAIEKVAAQERNVVVATGTGSGKTEAFLIPIFDHLLRQRETGLLRQPGVRALLLYPMNALANDQLKRLRRLLGHFPDITFGRYTGETQQEQKKAEDQFRQQFPSDRILSNEKISREKMWESPPHILITNYAMLEYLLLRPKDSEFFDGDTGQFWRFIALDEAHIYDGASGIEIAMLLRRLKDRVVGSEPGRLRCIATSATLGRGREDFPAVARFASEIFGETFEWQEVDPKRQDVVEGTRERMAELDAPWGKGSGRLYGALADAVAQDRTVSQLSAVAVAASAPPETVQKAERAAATAEDSNDAVNRFLHSLLKGDARLHALRETLDTPRALTDLATNPLLDASPEDVVHLVELAVRARSKPDDVSLLPARYHVFARALEGAFVCLNSSHPAHADEGKPRFFLTRHETCPHCSAWVFEMATCPRCGTAYIVGRVIQERGEKGSSVEVLRQPGARSESLDDGASYFVLSDQVLQPDEDEAVVSGAAGDALPETLHAEQLDPTVICLGCGALAPAGEARPSCQCQPTTKVVSLQEVVRGDSDQRGGKGGAAARNGLNYCVGCGARSPSGIVFRFLTGQDAPVSVLSTTLYQLLPPDRDDRVALLPGQGRKLLIFADSRQDAAFFAPYLERTYRQVLRRRLIIKALAEDPDGGAGRLRQNDLATRVLAQAETATMFGPEQSFDERKNRVSRWLAQELVALDYRIGLEGLGLLHFRLIQPPRWEAPPALLESPWNLSRSEAWELLVVLLNTLRQQGAVTYPPNVDPRDQAFAPRNVELFMQEYVGEGPGVLGWRPKRGSNRRVDFLARLLQRRTDMPDDRARKAAEEALPGIWRFLTTEGAPLRPYLVTEQRPKAGVVHRLDYRFWEWVPAIEANLPVYRCNRCHNVSYINLDGVCPANGCDGTLERVDAQQGAWADNHYRHLYTTLEPIPISAEEHTAQWTPQEAGLVQDRFIRGEINVLSCSTTFELGVDVGDLQAVLMRNVPPTTANYIQRAGRAGRRTDSVALVLTYAQRRSHDLSHFNRPERLVSGRILPPTVTVSNEKIVRRHVHSVLLAAFLRWARDVHGREFHAAGSASDRVGYFFAPEDGGPSGPDLLRQYIAGRPEKVQQAMKRVVPTDLHQTLDIENWSWLSLLTSSEEDGILDKSVQEVNNDLKLYAQLESEAVDDKRYRLAEHFQNVSRTVRSRDLLGFLGSRNVLPAYGFPTAVVELRTSHIPSEPAASRVELQRDLRVAIAEYAPGSEVVAAKRIWTGGGLYRMPGHDLPAFHYGICPECGRFHRSAADLDGHCTVCGANMLGRMRRSGEYIIPEFGFVAGREVRVTGEGRPQRLYASRIYFSDYDPVPGESVPALEPVAELSSAAVTLARRYSRYGKLAMVNSGVLNCGFRICDWCGWAEPAEPLAVGRRAKRTSIHTNPRTGKDCKGPLKTYHLGHEFITDVLELRFAGHLAQPDDSLWPSTLYALLEGASETLGIPRDDLDGTLYPYQFGLAPAIVLFDNVPGGAGHVSRIANALPAVVRSAWERMAGCECGPETSCYECLRNFYNQWCHDQLRRGLARDFLAAVAQQSGF